MTEQAVANDKAGVKRRHGGKPGRRWIAWTKTLKDEFLDHLAESCSVIASARAVGIEPSLIHHYRRRDAAFAADWETALEAGYVMIETRLVGHILAGSSRNDALETGGGRGEAIRVEDALRVLAQRDSRAARRARGQPTKGGARPIRALTHETDAALLKLLVAAERREQQA